MKESQEEGEQGVMRVIKGEEQMKGSNRTRDEGQGEERRGETTARRKMKRRRRREEREGKGKEGGRGEGMHV